MYADNPLLFDRDGELIIASGTKPTVIVYSSDSPEAVVIAVNTFADDVERVVGVRPDVRSGDGVQSAYGRAIYVGQVDSRLVLDARHGLANKRQASIEADAWSKLRGRWECWDIRTVDDRLLVTGSDRRGVIYALYTLSAWMGVSPWYWWGDVPVTRRQSVSYPLDANVHHHEPTVKYRGFFLNDEQPVLWNWAYDHFKIPRDQPPFQTGLYEKVFELCLRLKGNYMWPAMWCSMFGVDGQDVSNGLPDPTPGPNQDLAQRMGVVMGTSHHEPMSRNQKEYTDFGVGDWDYVKNGEWLRKFWEYGAERAKAGDCETVYTVGMRGDGDIELGNSSVQLLEHILKKVLKVDSLDNVPQMWAMYKEVMGFFANGLRVPGNVTPLLADDNWGNLMAVMPDGAHQAGGGIYYHADYVGDPRDYKWVNTVPLAKMWEQLNVAKSFKTTEIWILNVGDLKMLETPLEWFMDIAYDSERWGRDSLIEWGAQRARRDYSTDQQQSREIAEIIADYSVLASRKKAELLDDKTYSITAYDEVERVLEEWSQLESKAIMIHDNLTKERQLPFYEMILVAIKLQANLNRLYASVGKSNLYATQGRSAANLHADLALELFERDADLTEEFHSVEGGKWNHMLSQSHIGYQYWQAPTRQSLPPTSRVSARAQSYKNGTPIQIRVTTEDSLGAWPGDNKHNSLLGYNAPDPTLQPMDLYGRPRWIEIGSGGPQTFTFKAKPREQWMKVSIEHGEITPDGKSDARVWISVDWDTAGKETEGHVDITSSCGAQVTITLPIAHVAVPPPSFAGSIQGDGYVAIESGTYSNVNQQSLSGQEYTWAEVPYYGRTRSAVAIMPVGDFGFDLGQGPSLEYSFFVTSPPADSLVPVTLHLGPALNYVLGKRLAFGIQLDDGEIELIEPVPEAPLGSLPDDWEGVVADEIRKVETHVNLLGGVGLHNLRIWGVTTGIVLERILIDLGGIKGRGDSYLGPPESIVSSIGKEIAS